MVRSATPAARWPAWQLIDYAEADVEVLPGGVFWRRDDEMLYRHDGSGWQQWSLEEHDMLPAYYLGWWNYAVAPDGSLWAGWRLRDSSEDSMSSRCDGISRFDGLTWVQYLPGFCVDEMDFAPDGAVWSATPSGLHVITPEAVAASGQEGGTSPMP